MSVIEVRNLGKTYQVFEKKPGLVATIQSLVKRQYKEVRAINDISFLIEKGELVGFIGPNGAGKTTTLKVLSGLLHPDAGQVTVLGFNPWERKEEFLKQIGFVMGQKNFLFWDLPAADSFRLYKEIYEIPDVQFRKTVSTLADMLDFKELTNIQVRKLSLGQRMKAELIAALIHEPKVLFLDEPTIGLDVVMQKVLRDFIRVYNREYQATILLTSHYMEDVKELSQRVVIIDKGRIVYDGLLQEILLKYADHKLVEVILEDSLELDPRALQRFGRSQSSSRGRVVLQVPRLEAARTAASILESLPVADINIKEPEIENVIREVFSGKDLA